MIVLSISCRQIDQAERRLAAKERKRLTDSFTEGEGYLAGLLGEEILADALGGTIIDDYNYDIILNDTKVEVKTKKSNFAPTALFECSVSNYNNTQRADVYSFVFLRPDFTKAWLAGFIKVDKFKAISFEGKKDELATNGKHRYPCDCKNVFVKDLTPFNIEKLIAYRSTDYAATDILQRSGNDPRP